MALRIDPWRIVLPLLASAFAVVAQSKPCSASLQQSLVYIESAVEDGESGAITRHRGTGFLVRRTGYFLTNAHVAPRRLGATVKIHGILGAKQGVSYTVSEVTRDEDHDLLLLKFDIQLPDLRPLRLSEGAVAVTTEICSAGFNMVSPEAAFVQGTIASLGGGTANHRWTVRMPSVPGDSGAPVLGPNGEVIAIKVEGVQNGNGLNYVIPAQYALPLDQYAGPRTYQSMAEWGASSRAPLAEPASLTPTVPMSDLCCPRVRRMCSGNRQLSSNPGTGSGTRNSCARWGATAHGRVSPIPLTKCDPTDFELSGPPCDAGLTTNTDWDESTPSSIWRVEGNPAFHLPVFLALAPFSFALTTSHWLDILGGLLGGQQLIRSQVQQRERLTYVASNWLSRDRPSVFPGRVLANQYRLDVRHARRLERPSARRFASDTDQRAHG